MDQRTPQHPSEAILGLSAGQLQTFAAYVAGYNLEAFERALAYAQRRDHA